MDDYRVQWIKDQVFLSLNVEDDSLFEDLLERDEYSHTIALQKYLDLTDPDSSHTIVFYIEVDILLYLFIYKINIIWVYNMFILYIFLNIFIF